MFNVATLAQRFYDVYDLRPEKTCAVILMSFDLVCMDDEFDLYLYSVLGKS